MTTRKIPRRKTKKKKRSRWGDFANLLLTVESAVVKSTTFYNFFLGTTVLPLRQAGLLF